jgi:asparagine synthase (glutamine-hydrolysing)
MCGIVGLIGLGQSSDATFAEIRQMLDCIVHRGPDDFGMWSDPDQGLALGHRRLSILELSPAGHQPMTSDIDRYVIVFNGEIYNHLDLRRELGEGIIWRGSSDTETLLYCFTAWGIEKTLRATVGMFALALWDKREKALILARDRLGEKPLYYGWQKNVFLFGSELKSLRAHSAFNGRIESRAVNTFLHLNYIPGPYSVYEGIYKLEPGKYLHMTANNIKTRTIPSSKAYWSLNKVALDGLENSFKGSFNEAVDELEMLVRQSIQLQSVADVPVGAFLSGGIDSSTVVAMMSASNNQNINTFSIGMPDKKMDESIHALEVAKYFGANHYAHTIESKEALELIPHLTDIYDEPFADSSQIPTFIVSKIARRNVTVALSGDGGDEFFLGYPQYEFFRKLWQGKALGKLPWSTAFSLCSGPLGNRLGEDLIRSTKSIVGAWQLPASGMLSSYWMDRYRNQSIPMKGKDGIKLTDVSILNDAATTSGLWDGAYYLPDDILVKVDRASMANSLETRAPLLDHRIIEFAYQLPLKYKLKNGVGKRVLREVLYRHIPRELVDRPKMGFSIPLALWLKEDLRPWADELINAIPNDDEFLNKNAIKVIWSEHLNNIRDNTERLWGILSLLSFFRARGIK